ncbi:MAG: response regulator transcription factor [Bdellovibrionales bacterium]|nr:response regulator transcription factor [Bdellovibrionales bacterium]
MTRLLLVEDDLSLGATLKEGLEGKGFHVDWTKSSAETRRLLQSSTGGDRSFSIALLDVGLPDGSGFDLASEIRQSKSFPFLFMTAMNSAENRLTGYELGAEEFIPKPFHFRELLLRIDHVLKSHSPQKPIRIPLPKQMILDLDKMCVEQSSGEIGFLSLRDFRVLKLLIERSPKPVSRDEMLDLIWGDDQFPSQRTVDNCIVRLRQILGDQEGTLIRSVRGMGYQWILNDSEGGT